jgi:hypothetical protein
VLGLLLTWFLPKYRHYQVVRSTLSILPKKIEAGIADAEKYLGINDERRARESLQQAIRVGLHGIREIGEHTGVALERAMDTLITLVKVGGFADAISHINETPLETEAWYVLLHSAVEVFASRWSNPNRAEQILTEVARMLEQIDDLPKVIHVFGGIGAHDRVPQSIHDCLFCYVEILGQAAPTNIGTWLDKILPTGSTQGGLLDLGKYGGVGQEWLAVYRTFRSCWNASAFKDAADSINLEQLPGTVFLSTREVFSAIKEAQDSQPGDSARGNIRNQIQGLHEPHKSILEAIFIQRDWL